jgi:CRISPR-associated protein Csx14
MRAKNLAERDRNVSEQVLIATLGSEPQVVTLVLDLLRAKGYPIAAVRVVHTMGESVQAGLKMLAEEFRQATGCSYATVAIEDGGWPVSDVASEKETAALMRTLYRVVLAEKRAGRTVHLSIAGGRKTMAAYGMVVAQLLFDDNDHVWHLHSEGWRPGNERVMHARPGDGVSLLPVPILRWSSVSPVLTELAVREDPWEAIQAQRLIRQEEDHRLKQDFVEHYLRPPERDLVRLACRGLDNAVIARQLHKSEKTVANQFTHIYEKLHEWRGFREDIPVSRSLLVAEFAPYFAGERR